jgi:hypothetical protein
MFRTSLIVFALGSLAFAADAPDTVLTNIHQLTDGGSNAEAY